MSRYQNETFTWIQRAISNPVKPLSATGRKPECFLVEHKLWLLLVFGYNNTPILPIYNCLGEPFLSLNYFALDRRHLCTDGVPIPNKIL